MKYILVLIIAAAFAGYMLPAQQERTGSPCEALERRLRTVADEELAKLPQASDPKAQAALAEAKARLPSGAALEGVVRQYLPMLPPQAGCATGYWVTVFKPEFLRGLLPTVLPAR